jgi:hypothetical protein
MSLHSPEVYAQIVDSYIDGYRKRGWMPECRANNLPGWTQGGRSFLCRPSTLVHSKRLCRLERRCYRRTFCDQLSQRGKRSRDQPCRAVRSPTRRRRTQPPRVEHPGPAVQCIQVRFFSPHLCFSLCARAERCRASVVIMVTCLTAHLTLPA